jgi:hypothetical protein
MSESSCPTWLTAPIEDYSGETSSYGDGEEGTTVSHPPGHCWTYG